MTDVQPQDEDAVRRPSSDPKRVWHRVVAVAAASVAVVARLVPVLRGGGLFGLGNYDDGVYYAAGTALLHGLIPYRDYVFLHPPGIVLALSPFGLFGLLGHDQIGLAAARATWILLGGLNTVLVARILRPLGLLEAAAGALFYATAYPAIYIEWTPLLEGPAQTCVLLALLILVRPRPVGPRGVLLTAMLAGAFLGASATFKIWGVVAVVSVIVWLLILRHWRQLVGLATGSAAAVIVVCLPFFLAAPAAMWRMTVVDQFGRTRSAASLATRLAGVAGLGLHRPRIESFTPVLIIALLVVAGLLVLSATVVQARLAVVLTVSLAILLVASPSWFLHYPGLVTGPLAVALGAGAGVAVRRVAGRRTSAAWAVAALLGGLLLAGATPIGGLTLGRPFPGAALAAEMASRPGCVTADDPGALVEMNVLTRDLEAGCPFVADVGGYSYELASARGGWVPRRRDDHWQAIYLRYLQSGRTSLSFRYAEDDALDSRTLARIASWPRQAVVGGYVLCVPR